MSVTRCMKELCQFLRSGHVGFMKVLLKKCGVDTDCMCVYIGDLQTVLLKDEIIITVRVMFGWGTACDVPHSSGNLPSSRSNDVHGTVYIIQQ
jgi:hypothetical protein